MESRRGAAELGRLGERLGQEIRKTAREGGLVERRFPFHDACLVEQQMRRFLDHFGGTVAVAGLLGERCDQGMARVDFQDPR